MVIVLTCRKCKHGIFCPTWGMWKCVEKIRWIFPHESFVNCEQFVAKGANDIEKECQCDDCLATKGMDEE